MATSGTVGTTVIDTATVLEHAMRRAGLSSVQQTPETVQIANNNLYLSLTSLANQGINLWCIDKQVIGIYPNQTAYPMPAGTVDILNATRRTTTRLTASTITSSAGGTTVNLVDGDTTTVFTQASANGNVQFLWGIATAVTTVGLLAASTTTMSYVFECSSDGATWETLSSTGSITVTDGDWNWYDIDPAKATLYFRVRESGGGTISLRELYLASTGSEIVLARLNRDDYTSQPNKQATGDPINFWFDRLVTPAMYLWPTPATTYDQIIVWRHRQVQDIGTLTQQIEIPQRWMDAIIWDLAVRIGFEVPGVAPDRLQALQQKTDRAMYEAAMEEADRSPIFFTPAIRVYTV